MEEDINNIHMVASTRRRGGRHQQGEEEDDTNKENHKPQTTTKKRPVARWKIPLGVSDNKRLDRLAHGGLIHQEELS